MLSSIVYTIAYGFCFSQSIVTDMYAFILPPNWRTVYYRPITLLCIAYEQIKTDPVYFSAM